jgi:hypothetical protein
MTKVTYEIVEHDGGWAYRVGETFSERFSSEQAARTAAQLAAAEQRVPGETAPIQYEDDKGRWHEETARGDDRPATEVVDKT